MKSLNFVLFLSLALILGSCSSDDDKDNMDKLTTENFIGKYAMESYESSEVEYIEIQGASSLKKTTKKIGSVFKMDYDFQENNNIVRDGTFLIKQNIKVGSEEPEEEEYIERIDNESLSYSLDTDARTLVFDNKKYSIKDFSSVGFTLQLNEKDEDEEYQHNEIIDFVRK